jgi:signal transduction histidine kinase
LIASPSAIGPVSLSRLGRIRQAGVRFLLQACVWLMLSLAIAAMLVVGQPFEFASALRFAAANWMPWALITPIVFWTSGRFPIGRGHLARSIPIHLVVGLVCTIAVAWITLQLPFAFGPLLSKNAASHGKHIERSAATGTVSGSSLITPAGGAFTIVGQGPPLMTHIFGAGGPMFAVGSAVSTAAFQVPAPVDAQNLFEPAPPTFQISTGPVAIQPGVSTFSLPDNGTVGIHPMQSGALSAGAGGVVSFSSVATLSPDFRPPWHMLLMPLAMRANAGIAVYLIIASAAHAMAFYRQAQERERQSLALVASRNQAKLDALRLQLQPHFLFNSLNAISTLVHRDANAADNLIGDLSDLLRVSLQTTAHEVPLAREFELLEHYLAIEQARLGDRLRIQREIDPTALGAFVPTLILQPLAENAVRHGIEPRLAPGTLTLRAQCDAGLLRLTVADDGVGFDPAAPAARRGIGLANSEERLRTLHADRSRLDVFSGPEGGVQVEITLPFRTEPASAAPSANGRADHR